MTTATATKESCMIDALEALAIARLARLVLPLSSDRNLVRHVTILGPRADGQSRLIATDGRILACVRFDEGGMWRLWDGQAIPVEALEAIANAAGALAKARKANIWLHTPGKGSAWTCPTISVEGTEYGLSPSPILKMLHTYAEGLARDLPWRACPQFFDPDVLKAAWELVQPWAKLRDAPEWQGYFPATQKFGTAGMLHGSHQIAKDLDPQDLAVAVMPCETLDGPDKRACETWTEKFPETETFQREAIRAIWDLRPVKEA